LSPEFRLAVKEGLQERPGSRLTWVLHALGVVQSRWYVLPLPEEQRRKRGPRPKEVPAQIYAWVKKMAENNPWYGYKRIAVMCRRAGQGVTNKQAYKVMKAEGLLHKRKPRAAALYQAAKLWELLPQKPDDLWQMDVTYIHIPGHGWWYAVTVIDYYSRYLLGLRLTPSYCAQAAIEALKEARAEAERIHGPLTKTPFLVTDNGSSFIARRFGAFIKESYAHMRIQYRTPTQLGLLEGFHATLKEEEVYWRLYDSPQHCRECLAEFRQRYNTKRPHWALRPAEGGDPLVPEEVYAGGRAVQIPKWQAWAVKAKAELDRLREEAA
jgi:transposase InsO family protein